jgi:uncharacterized repeat protein (TIGR01451 family)
VRKLLAPVAALALVFVAAGAALAWNPLTLTANCAPDDNSYAWTINLPAEDNSKVDWSFDSDFASFTTVDFGSAGDHDFTTPRGGPTLYVRWNSDHRLDAQDSENANGDLCAPPPAPDIQIVKSNDADETVEPGTEVTYTYEVKNTGNVPLSDVAVKDQVMGSDNVACEPVAYQSSDGNDDDILDPGETWTFTCTTVLQGTTTNQACVSANVADEDSNPDLVKVDQKSEPVTDCDDNTVEVSHQPEQSVAESAAQTVEAGTGTPAGSIPNTSLDGSGSSPLPTILFSMVLLGSLGGLAYTNVKVVARRNR